MFGTLGAPEILVIVVILVLLFGPRQIPRLGKAFGETIREMRNVGKEFSEAKADAEQTAQSVTKAVKDTLKS